MTEDSVLARAREMLAATYDRDYPQGAQAIRQGDPADFGQWYAHSIAAIAAALTDLAAKDAEIARLREALEPFAACADEWDRWQANGSTSTPTMVRMWYGKARIGLSEYQAARAALQSMGEA